MNCSVIVWTIMARPKKWVPCGYPAPYIYLSSSRCQVHMDEIAELHGRYQPPQDLEEEPKK
ncbi:hypothetical protein CMI37_33320 [Candidatus Pacearchaeota archaeon]|nr:hypothetical protein [Candidatus Pacearchaeota archaeon]